MFRQSLAVMGDLCTRSMRIEHLQTARAKHERRTPADCTQSDLIAYTPTYTLHLLATFAESRRSHRVLLSSTARSASSTWLKASMSARSASS